MTQKKLYVIILSFFTIIIGVVCFSLGNYFDTNSLATEKLKTQISALEENTSSLTDTKNDLESQINDLNSELSTKTTVNNYFMEAKKKNDELKNDITELNQKSSELDSQIGTAKSKLVITGNRKDRQNIYIKERPKLYLPVRNTRRTIHRHRHGNSCNLFIKR